MKVGLRVNSFRGQREAIGPTLARSRGADR
jgi:hypothetical protein